MPTKAAQPATNERIAQLLEDVRTQRCGFPASGEEQGRQDSNLQPPVLETSGFWLRYARLRGRATVGGTVRRILAST